MLSRLLNSARISHRGVNVPLIVVSLPMLIGFMAVAIFTGITAYVSDAMHNVAQNAVLAGASAMTTDEGATTTGSLIYNFDGGGPSDRGITICNRVAAAEIAANPMLRAVGFALNCSEGLTQGGVGQGDNNTVRADGQASVPGGVLAMINMPVLDFEIEAGAAHWRQNLNARGAMPNNMTWPAFNCPAHQPDNGSLMITGLNSPVTDREGIDLEIASRWHRGYVIEGCAGGGTCYDIGRAANPQVCNSGGGCSNRNNGWLEIMTDYDIPGKGRRNVQYGAVAIDLGGTGGRALPYNGGVRHITQFHVYDDGVPIAYDRAGEGYWNTVCADDTTGELSGIVSGHHAVGGFFRYGTDSDGNVTSVQVDDPTPPAPYMQGTLIGRANGP